MNVRRVPDEGAPEESRRREGLGGPLEVCWRIQGESGREYECAIYRSHTWYDVRLVANERSLVYSQVASSLDRARGVATLWRATLTSGRYTAPEPRRDVRS